MYVIKFFILISFITCIVYVHFKKYEINIFLNRFRYIPKKLSHSAIFEKTIAKNGLGTENTNSAFDTAAYNGMVVELELKVTKDNILCCFSDRYTNRLLNRSGKFSNKTYKDIRKSYVLKSKSKVPKLERTLKVINKRVPIIINVNTYIPKELIEILIDMLNHYDGEVYFKTKKIYYYYQLQHVYNKVTMFEYNIFRKKLDYIEYKSYKHAYENIPSFTELNLAITEDDNAKETIQKIWRVFNKKFNLRLPETDDLFIKPDIHRGILNSKFKENSIEGAVYCNKVGAIPEIDFTWNNKGLYCYHDDTLSNGILKQEPSCAEKLKKEERPTAEEMLKAVYEIDGLIICDLKSVMLFSIKEIKYLMNLLEELNYDKKIYIQSTSPFHIRYLAKHYPIDLYPHIVRGLVCNTFEGIKFGEIFGTIINGLFSSWCRPDYMLLNLGKLFIFFASWIRSVNIPIIIYPPKSINEVQDQQGYYSNIIAENVLHEDGTINEEDWEDYYFYKDGKLFVNPDFEFKN